MEEASVYKGTFLVTSGISRTNPHSNPLLQSTPCPSSTPELPTASLAPSTPRSFESDLASPEPSTRGRPELLLLDPGSRTERCVSSRLFSLSQPLTRTFLAEDQPRRGRRSGCQGRSSLNLVHSLISKGNRNGQDKQLKWVEADVIWRNL
jgi:hypothetical protein